MEKQMGLKRKSPVQESTNSNVEYSNLEAGEHEGRLVYIADLGLQRRIFKNEEKTPAQQISLGIEIVGSSVVIDGVEKPRFIWTKPFNIFQTLNDRGLELKYYKVFNPSAREGQVADWDSVMGMPCNAIIIHEKDGDRTYDNIDYLTPIPAKYQDAVAPARITDMAIGDCDDENNPAQRAMFGLALHVFKKRIGAESSPKLEVVQPEADADLDDNIPF